MRLTTKQWRDYLLLRFLMLPAILTFTLPVGANEIVNTAVFGGDNLPPKNTNRAAFSASVATLQITKTSNKVAVQPGDTVLYRIAIRNTGNSTANNLTLTDTLPRGLVFEMRSLSASLSTNGTSATVAVSASRSSNYDVNIAYAGTIPPQGILNVVYAATVTPDGIRGNGRNLAVATAGNVRSNTASHQLKIRPGIVADCATLIGRVFVDKNFDGEQQPGEVGIPNAVIYMDDGNRILTDANGLFSVANVIAGNRTGTLDLTSLPGYIQAPNLYRIDKNSQSRLVRLAPGSMGRMNFAVTPSFREGR
jgi:uncharacterized repeat protein (TIGR01451 family)